jgi:hypothetical protein
MYKYIKLKHITLNAYLYISKFYNFKDLTKTIKVSSSDYHGISQAISNNR